MIISTAPPAATPTQTGTWQASQAGVTANSSTYHHLNTPRNSSLQVPSTRPFSNRGGFRMATLTVDTSRPVCVEFMPSSVSVGQAEPNVPDWLALETKLREKYRDIDDDSKHQLPVKERTKLPLKGCWCIAY